MLKKSRLFIITGFFGLFLVGIATTLIFVKNTFGSDILAISKKDCVPYNIFVVKGEQEYSAKVSWSTKKECMGFIQYGGQREALNSVGVDQKNPVQSKEHEVVLEKLLTTQKYYFLVNSDNTAYGYNGTALDFLIKDL
jgi:hypothetical protein